jgi:SagB-type dehydrogenase family enzyme
MGFSYFKSAEKSKVKNKSTLMIWGVFIFLFISSAFIILKLKAPNITPSTQGISIKLPTPITKSNTSIEEALKQRRSTRVYKNTPLTLKKIAQLLWAAQGITTQNGFRTAPSAGALYPLNVYLVTDDMAGLPAGVYQYSPDNHSLNLRASGDKTIQLANTSKHQASMLKSSNAYLVITGAYNKTTIKYGRRGKRYVHMEAGHVAENISLQAVSLKLGTVTVGSFEDKAVQSILDLPKQEIPLYIMPIGNS